MEQKIKESSRYLAMEVLDRVEKSQSYSNIELNHNLSASKLSPEDKALTSRLVYGVLQRKMTLDFYLSDFLSSKRKIESWVRQLLRLSTYQAVYLDRIPAHAIIDQAVQIAKERGHAGTGKFVNAVLRNLQRQELKKLSSIKDPLDRLAISYSMPKELLKLLMDDYGDEQAKTMAQSFLEEPHASARVNLKHISQTQAIDSLKEDGWEAEPSPLSQWGIRMKQGHWVESRAYKKGWITVQDESSMLVAEAMAIDPHHQVLDACAAPGGKSTHIANYLDSEKGGRLLACDIHDHKIKLIQDNAERQGFSDVFSYQKMNAKEAVHQLQGQSFDRILVDAPCSGFGLLKRKPEIKYTKSVQDIKKLSQVQREILDGTAPLLKSNGILLYSTCTVFKEENDRVVANFLADHPEFSMHSLSLHSPTKGLIQLDGPLQILPQDFHTDGFFLCALEKI